MKKVLMFSGKEFGVAGKPTLFRTSLGVKLYVGDVVDLYKNGDKRDTEFVVEENGKPFIMGIQIDCNSKTGKIINDWNIRLIKTYDEIKIGEEYNSVVVEEEKLKVGDVITASGGEWLKGGIAKIVKIDNGFATIEILKMSKLDSCPKVGETDSGWKLEWLKKSDLEQLNNNLEEDKKVEKNKKFKVGDKVKVTKDIGAMGVEVGDAAEIFTVCSSDYEIKMSKTGDTWFATDEYLEKLDSLKFEIITEGTTTIVRSEDGREGVAKLYYRDTYSKGFGIVAALGKALGIDLVEEVQKVVGSYKLVGIDLASPISGITMGKALKEPLKRLFKVGSKVKIPKTKSTGFSFSGSSVIDHVVKTKQDYLYLIRLDKRISGDVYVLNLNKIDCSGDYFALEDLELYEELESFKVGDIVRGIDKNEYSITNDDMTKGEVVEVQGDRFEVKILAHNDKYWIGHKYSGLESKFFELVSHEKPILKEEKVLTINDFKIGDKVVPHAKNGCGYAEDLNNEGNMKKAKEKSQPYLYIVRFNKEKDGDILVLSHSETATGGNYFLPTDVTLYVEPKEEVSKVEEIKTKEPVNFKVGDLVKIKKDLVVDKRYTHDVLFISDMVKYKGKTFRIKEVSVASCRLEGAFYFWSFDMLEKIEPTTLKTGDKVKMISEHPVNGFGSVKTGDIGIITEIRPTEIIVEFPNQGRWHAALAELELVKEEIVALKEFKVGDYIYFKQDRKYDICKINQIKDGHELWGNWTSEPVDELPKTIKEFEVLRKNFNETYVFDDESSLKRLVLVDDKQLKVGDKVTREKAIEILKAGGKIQDDFLIYHEEKDGALKYKNLNSMGKIKTSSGYDKGFNLHGTLIVVSLPIEIKVGQIVNDEDAERVVRAGGRVKNIGSSYEYYMREGNLYFKSLVLSETKSGGFKSNFTGKEFRIIKL